MGLEVAALVISGVGLASSISSQRQAQDANERAADQQREAQSEQKAVNAAQQNADRRALIREERVRRARILQGSENSGTAYSSGEAGATSSLATQYFANLGTSLGGAKAAANISNFQQTAADFSTTAAQKSQDASMFQQLGNLGANIFDRAATYQKSTYAPPSTQTSTPQMTTEDYLATRDN